MDFFTNAVFAYAVVDHIKSSEKNLEKKKHNSRGPTIVLPKPRPPPPTYEEACSILKDKKYETEQERQDDLFLMMYDMQAPGSLEWVMQTNPGLLQRLIKRTEASGDLKKSLK